MARRCAVIEWRRSMAELECSIFMRPTFLSYFATDDTRSIIHVWLISAQSLPEVKLKNRLRPYVRYVQMNGGNAFSSAHRTFRPK